MAIVVSWQLVEYLVGDMDPVILKVHHDLLAQSVDPHDGALLEEFELLVELILQYLEQLPYLWVRFDIQLFKHQLRLRLQIIEAVIVSAVGQLAL